MSILGMSVLDVSLLGASILGVSLLGMSGLDVSILGVSYLGGGGGGEGDEEERGGALGKQEPHLGCGEKNTKNKVFVRRSCLPALPDQSP